MVPDFFSSSRRPAAGSLTVFEGIDGSGKSTQSKRLAAALAGEGQQAELFAEPGPSPWGLEIRRLAREAHSLPPEEELRLFLADRRWDVPSRIAPALAAGKAVIMDRYVHSNACYQGARGLSREAILEENWQFAPVPDLVLWIDVPVTDALARIRRGRQEQAPLFEQELFLETVRAHYQSCVGESFLALDGTASEDQVFAAVWQLWRQRFTFPGVRD